MISEKDVELICEAEFARNDAIQVDSFTLEEYMQGSQSFMDKVMTPTVG